MPRGAPPGKIYEGTARGWKERGQDNPDAWLTHAILDAYESARENGDESTEFRVVSIVIVGSNPPSDYKVGIVPHP